jgi:serine/threonine protein kinase
MVLPLKHSSDVAIATNNKYVGITPAGHGISADLWYSIQRTVLTDLRRPMDVAPLRSQVCVVKLYRLFSSRIYLHNELPAMKRLQTVPEELRARFTEPLEFSEDSEKVNGPCWFSMRAIDGFTLSQVRTVTKASNIIIPQEFVFHVYLQLHEALQFLHTFDPPMIKGDLIGVNVMVDPTVQDIQGFPNIKLIDFGGAMVGSSTLFTKRSLDNEWFWLYRMVYDLAMLNHTCERSGDHRNCSHETEFTDFVDTLKHASTAGKGLDGLNLEVEINLQERLPRVLKIKRKYASPEALQAIGRLLEETRKSSGDKFPTDQQILDALNASVSITTNQP